MKKETLHVEGMTCQSCKKKIEKRLSNVFGVRVASVDFNKKTISLHYDETKILESELKSILLDMGYTLMSSFEKKQRQRQSVTILILAIVAYLLFSRLIPDSSSLLTSNQSVSFIVLFIIGLTTSFHCVSMCGGIALSQVISSKNNTHRNIFYNLGRVISYTVLGGLVGAIGAAITVDYAIFKYVPILLGLFMILFGLDKLNVISLANLGILKPLNKKLSQFKTKVSSDQGPFILGLLNGFIPCGPLQLMQFYALGTGSALTGALSMFAFSLGTVPLMLSLGLMIDKISIQSRTLIFKLGGALIIFLGVNMVFNAFTTIGISVTVDNSSDASLNATLVDGHQVIEFDLERRNYQDITVIKDIPVKLRIKAHPGTLNGCNRSLIIKEFGIKQDLDVGTTEITFTPTKKGTFQYSCWMGMIRNKITVID
ncbi:MAG: sulfite exporter TauE/SafE family protein [Turicibacter sp.]